MFAELTSFAADEAFFDLTPLALSPIIDLWNVSCQSEKWDIKAEQRKGKQNDDATDDDDDEAEKEIF